MSKEQRHVRTDRVASSAPHAWAFLAVAWAWLLLMVGCAASVVTLARGGYEGVLRTAIVCAGIAIVLLAFGIWRGGIVSRVIAVLGLVPFLFIVSEFLRRY